MSCHTSNQHIALFTGSFNPFTIGHESIVRRALPLFDKVVIAAGYNERKASEADIPAIEALTKPIKALFAGEIADGAIEVVTYSGLTVDLAQRLGACCIIRGVRNITDFEYEQNMADINRRISGIETLLLFSLPELASVSASVVRELQHFGVDTARFLPHTDSLPERRATLSPTFHND